MEWNIIEGKLVKNFKFKSQTELAQFLLKVPNTLMKLTIIPIAKYIKHFN